MDTYYFWAEVFQNKKKFISLGALKIPFFLRAPV